MNIQEGVCVVGAVRAAGWWSIVPVLAGAALGEVLCVVASVFFAAFFCFTVVRWAWYLVCVFIGAWRSRVVMFCLAA